MHLAVAYVLSAALFLTIDVIVVATGLKPLYDRHLGDMMRPIPRIPVAALFYLVYVAGLCYFVTWEAMRMGYSAVRVALEALFFGAVAYGTFEFSNLAIVRGWTVRMALVDTAWGAVLSCGVASAVFWLTGLVWR